MQFFGKKLWRSLMYKIKSKEIEIGFDTIQLMQNNNIKIDDVSILEYIVYDELKEKNTEKNPKED